MTLVEAVVLGVVQGITEFLPISSTAHLRVVPALLGWEDPGVVREGRDDQAVGRRRRHKYRHI